LWQFGDGVTSTQTSPTHTYTEAGVYTVALTVNGLGGTDTESKPDFIKVNAGAVYLPVVLRND
jgi:PKD repeat protein